MAKYHTIITCCTVGIIAKRKLKLLNGFIFRDIKTSAKRVRTKSEPVKRRSWKHNDSRPENYPENYNYFEFILIGLTLDFRLFAVTLYKSEFSVLIFRQVKLHLSADV